MINNKSKYLNIINEKFSGEARDLLVRQVELFYQERKDVSKTKYNVGDAVFLKKGTFLHGIFGELENFDYTLENGFISELIPYHKFDEVTEKINNDEKIWTYWGAKTKEVSFLPSLVSEKRQIAFILNMESDYAKELIHADIWSTELEGKMLEPFIDYRYYPKFLEERNKRTAVTTDRESAIMFGLPTELIEGVFVGRKIENDKVALDHIKIKLPDCYICNLDGTVIA